MKSPSGGTLAAQAPPRVLHAPAARANSWEEVSDLSARLGFVLDEWQDVALAAAMGERADGRWASRLVGVCAPRQQGKSQLIVARALAGVLLFGEKTIICSAHETDTARQVFERLLDVIEDNPSVEARVAAVMKAVGREYIRFHGGAAIRIKARSVSGSRGFSSDCLLLDEAQILGRAAWSSILPTMSARPNPQAWLLGTPPTPTDDGEVFGQLRAQGVAGTGSRVAYVEWAAELDDDFDDPATWAKANPAFGTRILHDAVQSERDSMTDQQFALERLGIWSPEIDAARAIDMAQWANLEHKEASPPSPVAFAVATSPDRSWTTIGLAGRRSDGHAFLQVVESGKGTGWVVQRVAELVQRTPAPVAVNPSAPAGALIAELELAGIVVTSVVGRQVGQACGMMRDGIANGTVRHGGQPLLNIAVRAAGMSKRSELPVWQSVEPKTDVTPLDAVTLAMFALAIPGAPKRSGVVW